MTLTESIEALMTELTDDNQAQLLPILADMLADAERHNEERALRYALANDKRPDQYVTESFGSTHCWRPDTQEPLDIGSHTNCHIPHDFERCMRHSDRMESSHWQGRYFSSLTDAWLAYLETAVNYYHLLKGQQMTGVETVEALLRDLTVNNQHVILPILADALQDAGFERRELALRWALLHNKYPTTQGDITETAVDKARKWLCAWHYEGYLTTDYMHHLIVSEAHCFLPKAFQERMTSETGPKYSYHGRYFNSVEVAWRAFLDCGEKYLELLK